MTGPAELVVTGRVATFAADGYAWVGGLAIAAGRVVVAGTAAEVMALAGTGTSTWRLPPEQLVLPSFTDAHLHLTTAALAADQPDLSGLDRRGVEAAIAAVHADRLDRGDADSWVLGHGWTFASLGEHPQAAWLDEAAPGRPVALWAHDHHSRWLNARAVQLAGLAGRPDPAGGRIERDADGRPTGIMYEAAAGLVDAVIGLPALGDVDWAVGAYARHLAELGVTSVHDPGHVAPDPELEGGPVHYRAMAEGGHLPMRVCASIREEALERAIEVGFHSGAGIAGDELGRYRDGWLKLFSDGALGSRTAHLLEPYEPDVTAGPPPGGARGMALRTADELHELAVRAAEAGIASEIHAIGDAAVRTVLDVLATVPRVAGPSHRVEHAQLVARSDTARFGTLGIAASVQPCHLISDEPGMRRAWGARAGGAFPLAAIDAGGALMPFGTDAPVESPDPWRSLAAAVTRRGPGWAAACTFYAEQALSIERALRAACLDGPRSAGVADEGHLGVGARADLQVVPASLVDEPLDADDIAALRPLATMLDGSVIHTTDAFDP